MTVEELANKRYSGEFVFMLGHLEGVTRFVFECFDPRPDHEGKIPIWFPILISASVEEMWWMYRVI